MKLKKIGQLEKFIENHNSPKKTTPPKKPVSLMSIKEIESITYKVS